MTLSEVGFRSERGPILISLMLSTGLVAVDATIVATAVHSIVGDLGGFSQFPWLFSAYLLTQAVSVPVYSKLADTIGRKPVILVGIGIFLIGSVLCGLAWDMTSLIAFRAVQGLGAGAILPIAVTIAGDIYTVAERARVQGRLASVWAISSVLGPIVGGSLTQFVSWRWVFLVNIPLCLLAAYMLHRNYRESVQRRRHEIDYVGALVLTGGLGALVLGLLEGGHTWAWLSWQTAACAIAGIGLLGLCVFIERRAAEPVVPLWLLSRRLVASTSAVSFGIGAILFGLTAYVPPYMEAVLLVTPIVAGLTVGALTFSWAISAGQAGRLYMRFGFRFTGLVGVAVCMVGAVMLWLTSIEPNGILTAVSCFIAGLGLGLLASPTLIVAQSSVPWSERGVVTGVNMFARSVGSAVGVAVFGAVANSATDPGQGVSPESISHASTAVFLGVLLTACAILAAVLAMPRVGVLPNGDLSS